MLPGLLSAISPSLWQLGFCTLFQTSSFHTLEWYISLPGPHYVISREQLLVEFSGSKCKNPGKEHSVEQADSDVHPIPITVPTEAGHWNHLHREGKRVFP